MNCTAWSYELSHEKYLLYLVDMSMCTSAKTARHARKITAKEKIQNVSQCFTGENVRHAQELLYRIKVQWIMIRRSFQYTSFRRQEHHCKPCWVWEILLQTEWLAQWQNFNLQPVSFAIRALPDEFAADEFFKYLQVSQESIDYLSKDLRQKM